MNGLHENWTDAQLDAFRDGELDSATADRLREELLASADLRRRLARLERTDAMAMIAMTTSAQRVPQKRIFDVVAGVGLLATAAIVVFAFITTRSAPPAPSIPNFASHDSAQSPTAGDALDPYASVRVVMTLSHRKPKQDPTEPAQPTLQRAHDRDFASVAPADPLLDAVRRAVDERRTDAAVQLLTGAEEDQRAAGFQMLGAALRSALTAQAVLEQLSPAQQVEACGVWARDPELRPIALRRLRELRDASDTASDAGSALRHLMQDASLRPWLRSYGLTTGG